MNPKLSAALAAAIWGTTFIVTTMLLPPNPVFTAAMRSLVGGLPLLLLFRQLPPRHWWGKVLLLGTLNCGIFFALFFVAAVRLPGGVAGTLQSLGPIFTVLIAWPLLGQRPTLLRLASVVAGAIGVLLLLTSGAIALDLVGALAGIAAAVSLALGGLLLNRWGRPAPLLAFTAWQLVVGGIELIVMAALIGDIPATITMQNALGFAYVGLIGTCASFALWFYAIETAGAPSVVPFLLLVPVVAFALDASIKGFVPTTVQALGAVIVLVSLLAGQIASRPRPTPAE